MCNLHWYYTVCTVLHLNCTALCQSELNNFFMYIINNINNQLVIPSVCHRFFVIMFRFSRIITSKITKRRSWQVVYQVQIPYKKGTRKSLCKPTDTAFGSLSTLKQSSRNDDMMPDFGLVNLLLMKLSGTFVSSSLFK